MNDIWIIILNWNGIDDTIECIESLLKCWYWNTKIILIDNDSKNNQWEKLNSLFWDKIIFIQNRSNLWFTWGCNIWIQKALELNCNYIMLLNNDTVVKKWFIEKLVPVLNEKSDIGIIWPLITYYKSEKIWFGWGKINYLLWYTTHKHKNKNVNKLLTKKLEEHEYITWCCMLIKKEVIDKIWMLDNNYFAYYEEVDYCFKARKAWYKSVINYDSIIEHKKSASAGNKWSNYLSEIQAYLMARNWVYFWKNNLIWIKKYWFIFTQYTILPIMRCIFQIRKTSVLKYYILWLMNKKWIIK